MRIFLTALLFLLLPLTALATSVNALLGAPVHNMQSERIGTVTDLILNARSGRLVYVVVDSGERFYTLPMRAFEGERLRIAQMDLASAAARIESDEVRFRRAGRLIGQPVTHPGGGRIGNITDIHFDLGSGEVERVLVETDQGRRSMPASVLAHGRFPPLTEWQVENPPADSAADSGFLRREPSGERKSLQDPKW